MRDDVIALFAFEKIEEEVKVLRENHYKPRTRWRR